MNWARPFVCLLLFATPVLADRLRLTNGEELEGLIEEDSPAQVTINMGVASLTLPRSRIASVKHTGSNDAARIQAEWQHRYFSHARFMAPAWRDLADEYNVLETKRRDAVEAMDLIRRVQEDRVRQLAELKILEEQAVELSRGLKGRSPDRDVAAYNALVQQGNEVGARRIVLMKDVEDP